MARSPVRLAVLGLLIVTTLTGCATGIAGEASPTPTSKPAHLPAEQAFLAAVADGPEITWPSTDDEKLNLGRAICLDAPTQTREQMIAKLMAPPKPWPRRPAEIVVDQAKGQLCPATPWAPVSSYVPPTPEQASDVGPRDAVEADGQWRVGTEETDHVLPGRYRTNGSSGLSTCYWAKLDPADPEHIVANDFANGPREVQLDEGDLFETRNCGTWTKQG